jgi:outer membrane protein OmpA-like peptidoglycan-associated protein
MARTGVSTNQERSKARVVSCPLVLLLTMFGALSAQSTFLDHESKGKALAVQRNWVQAREEFHGALSEAGSALQSAIAAFRIAQTYKEQGNTDAALDWYRQSLHYKQSEQAEQEMLQVEAGRVGREVTADEIKAALLVPSSERSPIAEANSIDLDILFGNGNADLTAEGKRQVNQLALAAASEGFQGKDFLITGYTDSVGTDEYNLKLSADRAQAVRTSLIAMARISAGRVKSEGKGKGNPKYPNSSEAGRRLNRRVQITVIDPASKGHE